MYTLLLRPVDRRLISIYRYTHLSNGAGDRDDVGVAEAAVWLVGGDREGNRSEDSDTVGEVLSEVESWKELVHVIGNSDCREHLLAPS